MWRFFFLACAAFGDALSDQRLASRPDDADTGLFTAAPRDAAGNAERTPQRSPDLVPAGLIGGKAMADQAQSPAEQWPEEPEVSWIGQKIDHHQQQIDGNVYDQMNPKARIIKQ